MRRVYPAIATPIATQLQPTQNTARQAACRAMNGITLTQSTFLVAVSGIAPGVTLGLAPGCTAYESNHRTRLEVQGDLRSIDSAFTNFLSFKGCHKGCHKKSRPADTSPARRQTAQTKVPVCHEKFKSRVLTTSDRRTFTPPTPAWRRECPAGRIVGVAPASTRRLLSSAAKANREVACRLCRECRCRCCSGCRAGAAGGPDRDLG